MSRTKFKIGDVVWCETRMCLSGRAYGIVSDTIDDNIVVFFVVAPPAYHSTWRERGYKGDSAHFFLAEEGVPDGG